MPLRIFNCYFLAFITLTTSFWGIEPIRTWTSSDGRVVEARFLDQIGDEIRIKDSTGEEFVVPLNRFSEIDQLYVKTIVKKIASETLFQNPSPLQDGTQGGCIVIKKFGDVKLLDRELESTYQEQGIYKKPDPQRPRPLQVGEMVPVGSTLLTGLKSRVIIMLTNGTVVKISPETKVLISSLWQNNFPQNPVKVIDLEEELSSSRTALKLDYGGLIIDVKKLRKGSSFLLSSSLGHAGIRGTRFNFIAKEDRDELLVYEGQVDYKKGAEMYSVNEKTKYAFQNGKKARKNNLSEDSMTRLSLEFEIIEKHAGEVEVSELSSAFANFSVPYRKTIQSAGDLEMIWCLPGKTTFVPSTSDFEYSFEKKEQQIYTVKNGFYLGKNKVTKRQFEMVMGRKLTLGNDESPATDISFNEASKFCEKVTMLEARERRMPRGWAFTMVNEGEWIYASKAGTAEKYYWGNQRNPNFLNTMEIDFKNMPKVGQYPPNPWGFYDMFGAIAEWTSTRFVYQNLLYFESNYNYFDRVGTGPVKGLVHVVRDSSWEDVGFHSDPRIASPRIGFRLALKKVQ